MPSRLLVALAALGSAACTPDSPRPAGAPLMNALPAGPLAASVLRGEALVRHTPDSLPYYAPGHIACASCHLDAGRDPAASPLTAAWTRYPRYLARTGAVVTMTDRVNYCLTRSLAGRRLSADSREMTDVLAYLAWLARGLPVGPPALESAAGAADAPPGDALPGDSARGRTLYAAHCTGCHGPDGDGRGRPGAGGVPAVWGPRSYAIGASMAREGRAARFIQRNMPLGRPNSLTAQQAADLAAYVNAHPRPDTPGKADDWPTTPPRAIPSDVPYATRSGHAAYRPPPVIARADPAAQVPPPPPAPEPPPA